MSNDCVDHSDADVDLFGDAGGGGATGIRRSWCASLGHLMDAWEYLIVSLPEFEPARAAQGSSAAVKMLNREGEKGWEAVGMTALGDGSFAVLLKRLTPPKRLRANEP